MMRLMKYELQRRKHMLIGAAITMLFAEGVVLLGIYLSGGLKGTGGDGWGILAIVMTVLLVVGGFVLAFLDAVVKLYSDFKQKHGYMIFMTPQSGYRIIWAKTIFAVLEIIAAAAVIAGCLTLSCAVVEQLYDGAVSKFYMELGTYTGVFFGSIGLGAFQIIAQLSIALLAVTVSRSMMRSNSYSWLIALLMYFALAMIVNLVNGALLVAFGVVGDIIKVPDNSRLVNCALFTKYFIIGAVTYSAWFTGCTMLSGRLVNRGIDL